ncbi:MAG TPA: adenylate/guanylate cyclase domain-containing protein [Chryseosolibacter sp.]|nr:adenylate/guanylate cyclase domain-containing protein [Chryseosolibacter sp.]
MGALPSFVKNLFQGHSPFEIEITRSEFNRTLLMLISLAIMLVAATFNVLILEESVLSIYGGYTSFFIFLSWIFSMLVFEVVVLWRINWFRKRNLRLPLFFRYIYSLIEISFPTLLMYYQVLIAHRPDFLDSPLFIFYFLIIFLSALHIDYVLSFIMGMVGAGEYALIVFFAYEGGRGQYVEPDLPASVYYVRCLMIVIMGFTASFIADQIQRRINSFLALLKSQRNLEISFGQQVSVEIAKAVNEQGDEAREFEATVMALDIRNFSAFAEMHTPAEVLLYQNTIFAPIIDLIRQHSGIVNQIMGDGLMATFGAPVPSQDHGLQAFRTAKSILQTLSELNERKIIPPTRIGIGLHTGAVITGNIGNQSRRQYSFSGSAVIIAFRVEQLNKEFDSELLITGPVKEKIGAEFPLEYLGEKTLKGMRRPIAIYRG